MPRCCGMRLRRVRAKCTWLRRRCGACRVSGQANTLVRFGSSHKITYWRLEERLMFVSFRSNGLGTLSPTTATLVGIDAVVDICITHIMQQISIEMQLPSSVKFQYRYPPRRLGLPDGTPFLDNDPLCSRFPTFKFHFWPTGLRYTEPARRSPAVRLAH
ncbi:hypothetical protein GGR50DRAFT_5210 [Xylaria sp. CBS 124048]|nr:hypothetical protein GGR50DRAFT_5210 [Xylaria sp. CBS 124048]